MDNLGDWLYIVFLVIAGLSGLLGTGKKKKQQTEVLRQPGREVVTETDAAPEKGFWEILQEMQKEAPQPQVVPKPQPKPPSRKAKKATALNPFLSEESKIYKAHIPEAHIPMQATPPTIGEVAVDDIEHTALDISFQDAAELRKAVIYAEILNRKY